MRTSSVFKSRWMALVWAAGILWTAYDIAEGQPQAHATDGNAAAANAADADQPTDATGAPVTSEDEQKLADEINSM